MSDMPSFTPQGIIKILKKKGFVLDRVKGSHHIYYHDELKRRVEIGDVWLNEKLRGKKDKSGKKYSVIFMKKVISKIWKIYPSVTKLSLIVSEDNIQAIKLYERLNFVKIKNISSKMLSIKKGVYMVRKKITKTT